MPWLYNKAGSSGNNTIARPATNYMAWEVIWVRTLRILLPLPAEQTLTSGRSFRQATDRCRLSL